MDEKLIEEISNTTGVPQMLVSRSAQARAEANGVDINSILSSWSSGSPAAPVATEVVEEAPVATEVVEEAPVATEVVEEAPVATEVVEEAPVATEVVEEAPVATEVVEEAPVATEVVEEAPVATEVVAEFIEPPADLFSKVARALQYGSLFGIITGFIQAIAISTYLYDGLILESETFNLITEYKKTTYIVALTLLTTFFAVINTVNVKKLLEANFIGHGIKTSDRESIFQGTGLGLMFGSITGFFITSSIGQTIEPILPEDPTLFLLPVFGSFWRIVLMSTLFQALISVISILLGVPKGLELFEEEEAVIIRNRITGSAVIPLGAILVGGIIAVLISQVFINFHDYAPLFALIISAAILLFSALMSAGPKIKITKNEVLITALGIITLTIIIASVAASQL
jgi:hypothetical protein